MPDNKVVSHEEWLNARLEPQSVLHSVGICG